jgi:hypothetical protein
MSDILKKMKVKEGQKVLIIHAESTYLKALKPLSKGVSIENEANGVYDVVQLFVKTSKELETEFKSLLKHIHKDTLVWISFPKKSSGMQSDLTMYEGWDVMAKFNYEGVAMISLNDVWSSCRMKPAELVKRSDIGNAAMQSNDYGEFIDIKNKTIKFPDDLHKQLKKYPDQLNYFNSLSYTNQKEYVIWILTAKQEKTRQERIEKMMEKLKNKKKNPADK